MMLKKAKALKQPTPSQAHVLDFVLKYGKQNHLSNEELASKFHLSYAVIHNWKNAKALPSVQAMMNVYRVMQKENNFDLRVNEIHSDGFDLTLKSKDREVAVTFDSDFIRKNLASLLLNKEW